MEKFWRHVRRKRRVVIHWWTKELNKLSDSKIVWIICSLQILIYLLKQLAFIIQKELYDGKSVFLFSPMKHRCFLNEKTNHMECIVRNVLDLYNPSRTANQNCMGIKEDSDTVWSLINFPTLEYNGTASAAYRTSNLKTNVMFLKIKETPTYLRVTCYHGAKPSPFPCDLPVNSRMLYQNVNADILRRFKCLNSIRIRFCVLYSLARKRYWMERF